MADQGLHHAEQVVGQERLGQEEVNSLASSGDGCVDVAYAVIMQVIICRPSVLMACRIERPSISGSR
jgi:hypothetical protein